jgi:TusA-related sulfurtransferase
VVDARGQRCPLPIIAIAAAARGLPEGTEVELRSTDPAARSDVAAWCRMRGHVLLEQLDRPDGVLVSRVRLCPRRPEHGRPPGPGPAGGDSRPG